MSSQPKISIITVVRNGEKHLEQCILSILNQSYDNIEFIVIDGKSTDGTLEIIKKYEKQLSYWASETDTGIYDAMNKGVKASTGDWLLFINSDDYLVDDFAIERTIPILTTTNLLIVYGIMIYILPDRTEIRVGKDWQTIKKTFRNYSMSAVSHQSTFHSKQLFKSNHYDTSYKLVGDYAFLLSHLKDHEACFIPLEIAKMRHGGSSTRNSMKLFYETCKLFSEAGNYKYFLSLPFLKYATHVYAHLISNKLFGPNLIKRIQASLTKHR